jgi:hypothetical protein
MAGTLRLSNTGTGNGQSTITTAASGDTTYTLPSGGGTFVTTSSTQALTVPFASGTASAPSVTFLGDSNTGIYSPGADQVAVATNGANRIDINSGGVISHKIYDRWEQNDGSSVAGYIGNANLVLSSGSQADFALRSQANVVFAAGGGTERMRLDSSGRLGIGTSSPTQPLHVVGRSLFQPATGTRVITLVNTSGADGSINVSGGATSMNYGFHTYSTADALYIQNDGKVGIGTTSPGYPLHVFSSTSTVGIRVDGGGDSIVSFANAGSAVGAVGIAAGNIAGGGSGNIGIQSGSSLLFATGGVNEKARIDSSGRLLVGTSSLSANVSAAFRGNSFGAGVNSTIYMMRDAANPVSGQALGVIDFTDSNEGIGAEIAAVADANWGAGDYPGRLVFSTTADGDSSPTERMRIDNAGKVFIGKTSRNFDATGVEIVPTGGSHWVANATTCLSFNRLTNDGDLIEFGQGGFIEGTISVSGTTVSYNGAHLSRWSQLPGGVERTEILRGTVLSNIDEMCEWGEEENEQLNRMQVSDVEGDKNVAGVFQAWDDDDDTYTNDFYCAMTGDFVIRIGAGITVERGDLLMSAGDGTAKPQADDLVRSCTVAKVTSANVSCTYDDGSYCVPCVLMAC